MEKSHLLAQEASALQSIKAKPAKAVDRVTLGPDDVPRALQKVFDLFVCQNLLLDLWKLDTQKLKVGFKLCPAF